MKDKVLRDNLVWYILELRPHAPRRMLMRKNRNVDDCDYEEQLHKLYAKVRRDKGIRHVPNETFIEVYEGIFHAIRFARTTTMNHERVVELLDAITKWSQSHDDSNGEKTELDVEIQIYQAFDNLQKVLHGK